MTDALEALDRDARRLAHPADLPLSLGRVMRKTLRPSLTTLHGLVVRREPDTRRHAGDKLGVIARSTRRRSPSRGGARAQDLVDDVAVVGEQDQAL